MQSAGVRWIGVAGLAVASLAMLGGSALGGGIGSLVGGYGLLLGLGGAYLLAAMSVQRRAVQRVRGTGSLPYAEPVRSHGHRVF
jgi:hypothetical protein